MINIEGDGSSSGSCPVVSFGTGGVESPGSVTTLLLVVLSSNIIN
jgi:hypothetical protein